MKKFTNLIAKTTSCLLLCACITTLVACKTKTAETGNEPQSTTLAPTLESTTIEEITTEEPTTEKPFSLIEYVNENYSSISTSDAIVLNKPETSEGRLVNAGNLTFTVLETWTLDTSSSYDTYINLRYNGESDVKKYFVVKVNFFGTTKEYPTITEEEFIEDMCAKVDSFSKEDPLYSKYSALCDVEINGYKGYSIINERLTGTYTDIIYFYLYVDGYVYEIYGTYFADEINKNIKAEALESMYSFLATLEYSNN